MYEETEEQIQVAHLRGIYEKGVTEFCYSLVNSTNLNIYDINFVLFIFKSSRLLLLFYFSSYEPNIIPYLFNFNKKQTLTFTLN